MEKRDCGGITGVAIDITLVVGVHDTAATVVVPRMQHISLYYGPVIPVVPVLRVLCRVLVLRIGFGLSIITL